MNDKFNNPQNHPPINPESQDFNNRSSYEQNKNPENSVQNNFPDQSSPHAHNDVKHTPTNPPPLFNINQRSNGTSAMKKAPAQQHRPVYRQGQDINSLQKKSPSPNSGVHGHNTEQNNISEPEEVQTDSQIEQTSSKKKKKKHSKVFRFIKKLFTVIITTLLSLMLVMIITGTIVSTALTVYVLDFMEETTGVTLQELESGSNTYFYGFKTNEKTGDKEPYVIKSHEVGVQRIPVSIDQIPQHVRDAFTCTEDERFYSHDGVDYKRTFSAFLNMFIHIYDTEQGGSTITQQLVKNLTGDEENSPQRKIREIFRAMQLEKNYSKDEILEEYLNYIGFGGPINGIQLASIRYFGKEVSEIDTAEAAALAAIPKSPNYYGLNFKSYDDETHELILDGRANNKKRQRYVLWQMYKNGAITYDEYQQSLNEKLIFTDSEEYLAAHPEDAAQELEDSQKPYSWELDAMYFEAADYLSSLYNIDRYEAIDRINAGGYSIYSTVDYDMQQYINQRFLELGNLVDVNAVSKWADIDGDGEAEEYLPHVAFIALNYDGSVRSLAGDWGEKNESLVTNYAVDEKRQVGSSIKPVATYGLALEHDHIHWGSVYKDESCMEVDGKPWPTNYTTDGSYSTSGEMLKVYYALQRSYNTVPAKLCLELTPAEVFKFSTETLGLKLDPADEAPSPLSVGALTNGVTLENLVNAYLPYGNEGVQCDAHIVSRIEQGNHNVIYENKGNPRQAVSSETAWVMNRLLKNVVDNGTGTGARLADKVVCGKTGTTDNWYDLTFVGLTRDFVSGITIGYKYYNDALKLPSYIHSGDIWQNVVGEYANSIDSSADFNPDPNVIEAPMCAISGKIASTNCPKGVIGYWKSSNQPVCDGYHYVAPAATNAPTEGAPAEGTPEEGAPAGETPAEEQPPADQEAVPAA